jgi:NAD(P)H-hydrate epimerase
MEVVSGEQMRRIDRRTIEGRGIPGLQLMEAAGRGVARALLRDYPDVQRAEVLVLCGKGNNGGDGLVAARHLLRAGVVPRTVLLARAGQLRGDAAHNYGAARRAGLDVEEVPDEEAWGRVRPALESQPLVIDAVLGTGVEGGARGLPAAVIRDLNRNRCRVVAVDVPSGINADTPEVEGFAVRAERTYTLCRPKLALLLDPGAAHAGIVTVVPIGIPDDAVRAENPRHEWVDSTTAASLLPPRARATHKGHYGHLLAVAGSRDKSGAAVLLARGALRAGVGLMTVATTESAQLRVAVQQAEVMTETLAETADGGVAPDAVRPALELLARRDALAIGPGLGSGEETRAAVLAIIDRCEAPLVIDADGLNALAGAVGALPLPDRSRPAVLTPHPGEAARLLGRSTTDVQRDRVASARDLARISRAVVVLKGHQSLVADPDGLVAINSTGNPGMASGGTGDVLTGIVGALLARGLDAWDAARLAVHVHGDAGDRAARRLGQDGLIASDLLDELPAALAALRATGTDR